MVGVVQASDPDDPSLFLGSGVNNDTLLPWIGYQVNLVMNVPFTYVLAPSVSTVPADSWFVSSGPTPATLQGPGPYAGLYESTFTFSAGTPLMPGDEIDFNYGIHFATSFDYVFTQEMIPLSVPEPTALALVGLGGLMVARRLRRGRV